MLQQTIELLRLDAKTGEETDGTHYLSACWHKERRE